MHESQADIEVNKFTMAPNWLFQAHISAAAHLTYVVLLSHDWSGKRVVWPSVQTIAAKAKIGKSTAYRALRELEGLDLITIEPRFADVDRRHRLSNQYHLNELSKREIEWLCRRPTGVTQDIPARRKPPVTAGTPPVSAGEPPVGAADPPVTVTAEVDKEDLDEVIGDETESDQLDLHETYTHASGVGVGQSQEKSQEESQEHPDSLGNPLASTDESLDTVRPAEYPTFEADHDFGSLRRRLLRNR